MADRPYRSLKIDDIEALAEKSWENQKILSAIHHELSFRKTLRAKGLYEVVSKKLKKLSKEKTGHGQSPTQRPRQNNGAGQLTTADPVPAFPESANIISNFINALELEIEAAKKQSITSTIDLTNGKRVESNSEGHIYAFPNPDGVNLRDDMPIVLVTGDGDKEGTVVSVNDERILISIETDMGPFLPFAKLRSDMTFLLLRLKERFESVREGETKLELSLLKKAMGEKASKVLPFDVTHLLQGTLNASQFNALKTARGNEVSYLWGPPGTGKTWTLAHIIEAYYRAGMRVLIVSNTNQAVDALLEKLCERLKGTCEEFEKGSVLRFGRIVKEELKERFGSYVDVELAVARLSENLEKEKRDLQQHIAKLDKKNEASRDLMAKWERRESLSRQKETRLDRLASANAKLKSLGQEHFNGTIQLDDLNRKLARAQSAGTLKRLFTGLNPDKIKAQVESQEIHNQNVEAARQKQLANCKEIENETKRFDQEIKALDTALRGVQLEGLRKEMKAYQEQREVFSKRIREINEALDKIKENVLKACRVVASTATQAYLKPTSFGSFDAVVVDEASMLPLPAVGYVTGLATKQVVVAGDFRQLPPIIISKDPFVKAWMGEDIFNKVGIAEAVGKGALPDNLARLTRQYRMDENICGIVNRLFYGDALETDASVKARPPAANYPDVLSHSLTLVDTSDQYPFANLKPNTYSRYNVLHAVGVRNLCWHLKEKGCIRGVNDVGVISPYAAQATFLSKLVAEMGMDGVACGTVHRFQGNEKETIIFDTTDSYGLWQPGRFLQANVLNDDGAKLLNVALSRPRGHLVVFANRSYLESKLPGDAFLRDVLRMMEDRGNVVPLETVLSLGPNNLGNIPLPAEVGRLRFDPSKTGLFNEETFDAALLHDIRNAQKTVVVFSGFCTASRVAMLSDMFRAKINEGVKIRVVTRPPESQGSIPADSVSEALHLLQQLGVIVDLRYSIHEKACFIDDKLLWHGSLNPLSHTGQTEETMMRIKSREACLMTAEYTLFRNRPGKKDGDVMEMLASQENPTCESCGALSVFHTRGRFGPYFKCLSNCGWSVDLNRAGRKRAKGGRINPGKGGSKNPDSPRKDRKCKKCGKPMVERSGRYGPFLGCQGYPACRYTENLKN